MVFFRLNKVKESKALASSLLENKLDVYDVIEGRIFEETVNLYVHSFFGDGLNEEQKIPLNYFLIQIPKINKLLLIINCLEISRNFKSFRWLYN